MASATLLMLTKEVRNLESVPAGPQRKVACARPRRLFWDAVAHIQASLMPLNDLTEGEFIWQQGRAQEALDCLQDLQGLLQTLQEYERESIHSQFTNTEYSVITSEINGQISKAEHILGLFTEEELPEEAQEAPQSQELWKERSRGSVLASTCASSASDLDNDQVESVETPPVGCQGKSCSHFEPREPRSRSKESCCSSTDNVQQRKTVRLSPEYVDEFLEDDYHACKHAVSGICEAGCTVGGCQGALVEAW